MLALQLITHARPGPAAVLAALGPPRTHFGQRALERGARSVPGDALKLAVEWAVSEGREDLAQLVFQIDAKTRVFRFLMAEGVFFALVAPCGVAVTVYDAAQLREVRDRRRWLKRVTGRRQRQLAGAWTGAEP